MFLSMQFFCFSSVPLIVLCGFYFVFFFSIASGECNNSCTELGLSLLDLWNECELLQPFCHKLQNRLYILLLGFFKMTRGERFDVAEEK